jgi:hypothetical protein
MNDQILRWTQRRTSDDMGSRERPALVETIYIAHAAGFEWMVAPHDDGTWNWFMLDDKGEPQSFETDFPDADAAKAAAELAAAAELEQQ